MKKLLVLVLASTVGFSAFASSEMADSSHNHKRPAISADMKQAMDDCAKDTGVKRSKDSRPSKADMQKLDACMTDKGYEKPEGHGKRRPQ